MGTVVHQINARNGNVDFSRIVMNSYLASALADYPRQSLLNQGTSFTVATVMSSRDKVNLLEQARRIGYRTYLYFIATDDPEINVSRVQNRVKQGGHSVPEAKIIDRYARSLDLLSDAIRSTNRAYMFDNSGHLVEKKFVAEITDGKFIEIKIDQIAAWFANAVLKKISE